MKRYKLETLKSILPLFILFIFGCQQDQTEVQIRQFEEDEHFPISVPLNKEQSTVFLPTLESEIPPNKNSIYTATTGFAWAMMVNSIPLTAPVFESKELEAIHHSESYRRVMYKDDFISVTKEENLKISVQSYFKMLLPFVKPLARFEKGLLFKGNRVDCFGADGMHKTLSLDYYVNDDDFALELKTADQDQQIILIKYPPEEELSIHHILNSYQQKRKESSKLDYTAERWKNVILTIDTIRIPMIAFNYGYHYKNMEGTKVTDQDVVYIIDRFYQRVAFVLNEEGAKVESKVEIEGTRGYKHKITEPIPKKLYLDDDFLIILKRRFAAHPYFAAVVQDTEILRAY